MRLRWDPSFTLVQSILLAGFMRIKSFLIRWPGVTYDCRVVLQSEACWVNQGGRPVLQSDVNRNLTTSFCRYIVLMIQQDMLDQHQIILQTANGLLMWGSCHGRKSSIYARRSKKCCMMHVITNVTLSIHLMSFIWLDARTDEMKAMT